MASAGRLGNFAAVVFLDHGRSATGEISETVGEIAVVTLDERVVTEIAVLAENGFAQKIVAKSVHAEDVNDRPRANDVAERLAHFGAVHQQPAVGPDLFRQRKACGHQEGGPVDGMKADDFFSDEVEIGGKESGLLVLRATDSTEIGGERIEPDVKNVRLFPGNGNAPANRGARDAEIAEAAFDEAENFVAAGFRRRS